MVLLKEACYVIMTEFMILVPGVSHVILCSRITHPIRVPFCIISSLFVLLDTFFLFFTVFRDPGRMNKNFTSEDPQAVVQISNQTFTLKSCTTCKTLKDLRTHHCKVCDYCVDRLDHHCPWVANCIGRNNHRTFILLLTCTSLNSVYMIIANSFELTLLDPPPGKYGGEAVLIIYSIVLGWSIISLLFYQLCLIMKNRTTHEHRRKLFKANPFDYGAFKNCKVFWSMKRDFAVPLTLNRT